MTHSIEERVAYFAPLNVAITDITTEAQAIPDELPSLPPPPPSAFPRTMHVFGQTTPVVSTAAAPGIPFTPQPNEARGGAPHVESSASPPHEADEDAATIASLRRSRRWPAWLHLPQWVKNFRGSDWIRTRRQWLLNSAIAIVALLVGWSIGAKPWSQWSEPKRAAMSAKAKKRVATHTVTPSPATIRGKNLAKPNSPNGTAVLNDRAFVHGKTPAKANYYARAKSTNTTQTKVGAKSTSYRVAKTQAKKPSQVGKLSTSAPPFMYATSKKKSGSPANKPET